MEQKPLDRTTKDYAYMIFENAPLLDGNKEPSNVNELTGFHEELHQAANSTKLHLPQPTLSVVTTSLPSIHHNNPAVSLLDTSARILDTSGSILNKPSATSNFSKECTTQASSSKDSSLLLPLSQTSSSINMPVIFNDGVNPKEVNEKKKDNGWKHTSLAPISIESTMDEIMTNSQLLVKENCPTLKPNPGSPVRVTTNSTFETKGDNLNQFQSNQTTNTSLISFKNPKMTFSDKAAAIFENATLGNKEDTYASFKSDCKVTSMVNFSTEKIPTSQLEDSPNFSQIHLSSSREALFPNHSNFDTCSESNRNTNTVFPTTPREETTLSFEHTQQHYKSESHYEKKGMYDFEKMSTDTKTQQTSTPQLPSQELNRVHDHLLTSKPLLPPGNKTQDGVEINRVHDHLLKKNKKYARKLTLKGQTELLF
uniref:Uncharacterized protein n=1 Tax=Cacopsylla melanoneura TaxID=428564 RepID=A0A8D8YGY4_9HEMI